LIDDYLAAGLNRKEAERRAFLEFGNVAAIEEASRDIRGRRLEDLSRDLRYTIRTLRRSPGFAAVAVLSLGLGIGANAAIFTLINAVMLRTLPVNAPDRLVRISRLTPEGRPGVVSYPLFEYFRDNVKSISGAFAHWIADQSIVIDGEEELVTADIVTGAYYDVLGIGPAAGRLLVPADDDRPSSPVAAVLSDSYWERRFGRSPSAIGKSFTVRNNPFTIVGVTSASFQGVIPGRVPDITVPLQMSDEQRQEMSFNVLNLMARLKAGATVEQANAEVQVVWSALRASWVTRAPEKERAGILSVQAAAVPAPDGFNPFRYNFAQSLLILMGTVGLVLLLACVNLSGLLLARAAARQREISIRLAIGAGRERLIRQFLTESLVLAAMGGSLGLAIAGWFSARLVTLFGNGSPVVLSVAPDWRVLAFTTAISIIACVIAGLAPALQAVRVNVNPALKQVPAAGSNRLAKTLVVAQLAISMILIVGATLFVGTLVKLYAVDRGFNSDGILVVNVRSNGVYTIDRAKAVQAALLDRLRTIPGVRSASAAQVLPIGGGLWTRNVQVEGYTFRSDEPETVGFNVIAPAYFQTLGTELLSGREFDGRDTHTSPKVAIVNESFARYFFRDRSALGRRVTSLDVPYEIVGVVRDAKYENLRAGIMKTMYIPWMQRDENTPARYSYLARVTAGDPLRLVPGVEHLIREADPGLRMRTAITYGTLIDRSLVKERILAMLAGLFGVLALVVAVLGMFGVLAFQVTRRTNEFGVRRALGASRLAMIGLVLRDLVWMVAAGVVIGSGTALMLTGLARRILFGLTPTDPGVFVVAASVLAVAAGLAGWLPAHRASRVDPLVALRHE